VLSETSATGCHGMQTRPVAVDFGPRGASYNHSSC
jgi:hypothetical protein